MVDSAAYAAARPVRGVLPDPVWSVVIAFWTVFGNGNGVSFTYLLVNIGLKCAAVNIDTCKIPCLFQLVTKGFYNSVCVSRAEDIKLLHIVVYRVLKLFSFQKGNAAVSLTLCLCHSRCVAVKIHPHRDPCLLTAFIVGFIHLVYLIGK